MCLFKGRIFLISAFCLFSNNLFGIDYPNWFFSPPKGSVIVFAKNSNEALENGLKVYSAYSNGKVEGAFTIFYNSLESDDSYKDTDYNYLFSPLQKNNLEIIDSIFIDVFYNDKLYLLSTEPIKLNFPEYSGERPAWVNSVSYVDNEYSYGVGLFTLNGRKADGWIKSEENGVFNLLIQVATDIHTLSKSDNENYVKIEKVRLSYEISGIEVVGRWIDRKDNIGYTLVRAKTKNIIVN